MAGGQLDRDDQFDRAQRRSLLVEDLPAAELPTWTDAAAPDDEPAAQHLERAADGVPTGGAGLHADAAYAELRPATERPSDHAPGRD